MTGPESAPDFAALDALIGPRLVAMIGASDDLVRIGGRPIDYMQRQSFAGAL